MSDETIGELHDQLPADEWVNLPEYGIRVKRWEDPKPAPIPAPQPSTSARLRQAQQDLAASQADLTTALAERDEAKAIGRLLLEENQQLLGDRDELTSRSLALKADLNRAEQERGKATRLLEYALHLRMHGERAPGGDETWAQFDQNTEHFLRGLPVRPTPHLDAVKRERDLARAELASARQELEQGRTAAQSGWVVARDGGRNCERCEAEITRGQAYELQPGTGGLIAHVRCPDPTPTQES